MTPKLQISTHVLQRLEKVQTQCSGCLFGVWYKGTLLILGFNVESATSTDADRLNFKRLQNGFPAELDLCGLVKFGLCTDAEAHMTDILMDVDVTDNPILLHCELGTTVGLRASLFKHGQLERIPFEEVGEQQLRNEFVYTRLSCRLDIDCAEDEAAVKKALQTLRVHLASGRTGFNIKHTPIYLMGGGTTGTTLSGCRANARITDLLVQANKGAAAAAAAASPQSADRDDGFGVPANVGGKGKKKAAVAAAAAAAAVPTDRSEYEVLAVKLLVKMTSETAPPIDDSRHMKRDGNATDEADATGEDAAADASTATDDADADTDAGAALHLTVQPDQTLLRIPLLISSLALLHRDTAALGLYDILIEGLCRSIRLVECGLVEQHYLERCDTVGAPSTHNFLPAELGHFFSCVYFTQAGDGDEHARQHRQRLHEYFGLAVQRPHFRRANRYRFADDGRLTGTDADGFLVNPHEGIRRAAATATVRSSGGDSATGRQYLVAGRYTYHHYMQAGFDDNGWGCAYRSLQTLCSWFRWQGYSEAPVPDHRSVQRYLVEIGDKPHTFVGSRQWIGSMEVSMCMDGFMGVQCRIMRVDSGAELASRGPELVRHFETHGTPIMIGGGVLAHTILGVEYNATSGELNFLILDPHYTGADDLATVLAKRWCAWKGSDFWDKKSYYNLCMPQLPTTACF